MKVKNETSAEQGIEFESPQIERIDSSNLSWLSEINRQSVATNPSPASNPKATDEGLGSCPVKEDSWGDAGAMEVLSWLHTGVEENRDNEINN